MANASGLNNQHIFGPLVWPDFGQEWPWGASLASLTSSLKFKVWPGGCTSSQLNDEFSKVLENGDVNYVFAPRPRAGLALQAPFSWTLRRSF